jgi:hypothetical protein
MRTRAKLLLSAVVAALALSAVVSTAQARRFELSNQFFRIVWSGPNKLTFEPGRLVVACEVTLEGSFHSRTLSKVSGQLVGYVTFARIRRPCVGGNAWTLDGVERPVNTLPWHIRYDSFQGVLPSITGISFQVINASFLLEIPPMACLYASTSERPLYLIFKVEAGVITSVTVDPTKAIPLFASLTLFCPTTKFISGVGTVSLQGSTTTRIKVRLIQ